MITNEDGREPLRADDRLVVHDAVNLALAGACGAAGAIVSESLEVGALMAGSLFALGWALLGVSPLRRCVNRLAIAVSETSSPQRKR